MTLYSCFESAIGRLLVTADAGRLTRLFMLEPGDEMKMAARWVCDDAEPVLAETRRQVGAYFSGGLRDFDLPLEMQGTPFQRLVWDELRKIPFGTTISYLELARRVGNIRACRAVGAANGRNPISIVVPCHRVIGTGGGMTGYGGGLRRKEYLIAHEAGLAPELH